MNLKCKINGVEYNIAQGATFAEEYNETLDSGTIIIPQVKKIKNLMPFDDVFIYDSESEFIGYGEGVEMPKFYKHLLVDQYSEELVNLDEGIFTYKIELMSETKKLEVIQLPNISITQPLKYNKKKSIYEYLINFVELYSPLKKVINNENEKTWVFKKKYSISESLKEIFNNVISPDFSLNNPSLKDALAQLMLVKDRIPYVKDDIIYAMDISVRKGKFDLNRKYVNYVSGSRSSANHADNLKRTYSNALSQDNTCNMVEYMGFRNSNSALLTIENMRLETRYPIYKINKVYMCYYKRVKIKNEDGIIDYKYFLCKQDISKLVKLNSERNLLSQDWSSFDKEKIAENTIDELAKFKMMTIGYDIGSNLIEGWGTKYTYPANWVYDGDSASGLLLWDNTATYIQNIFSVINNFYPLGIYEEGYFDEYGGLSKDQEVITSNSSLVETILQNEVVNPFVEDRNGWELMKPSMFLKSLFFIVDYNAFYNGTVIHSKDNVYRDDITINDNSSSSLTLLEKDGIFQKEKINRFGNKGIAISARYTDVSQLQELGSVYENEDDDDVVIYHREYSIWDNVVNCSYAGTKNYVLKNYFTSVFARHRTYNLMSYGESTTRAENNKMMILLSKNKSYYESENQKIEFSRFDNNDYLTQIFSFTKPTEKTKAINFFENRGQINMGVVTHKDKWYLSDVNSFVCGNSLCFNVKMFDNVSGGVYIKELQPKYDIKYENDFIGSVQDWYMMVDDIETGQSEYLGFYVLNLDDVNQYADEIIPRNIYDIRNADFLKDIIRNRIMKLPFVDNTPINFTQYTKNKIGGEYKINKDNKETIDMTFQIEPITYQNDVIISPWIMKLSDLLTTYNKFDDGLTNIDFEGEIAKIQSINTDIDVIRLSPYDSAGDRRLPMIIISINKENLDEYQKIGYVKYNKEFKYEKKDVGTKTSNFVTDYSFECKEIVEFNEDYILVNGIEKINFSGIKDDLESDYYSENKTLKLIRIKNNPYLEVPKDKIYFSNIILTGINEKIFTEGSSNALITRKEWVYEWADYENKLSYYNIEGEKVYIQDLDLLFTCGKMYTANARKSFYLRPEDAYFDNSVYPRNLDDTLIYTKNMYIVLSKQETKKDIIYEEYLLNEMINEDDYEVKVYEQSGDLDIEFSKERILRNLSIGNHELVVSWNENSEEGNEIVISLDDVAITESQLKDYGINIKNLHSDDIFGDKNYAYSVSITVVKVAYDLKITDVFSIEKDELNREYLKVDLTYANFTTRSVQYWYLNNGSLKFVFAVNVTDDDLRKGYVKIYLSLLSTRDTRVYDDKNNIVGEICNYADPNNTKTYGKDQYYCDIINNE